MGASVSKADTDKRTCISHAAAAGHALVVQMLLKSGAAQLTDGRCCQAALRSDRALLCSRLQPTTCNPTLCPHGEWRWQLRDGDRCQPTRIRHERRISVPSGARPILQQESVAHSLTPPAQRWALAQSADGCCFVRSFVRSLSLHRLVDYCRWTTAVVYRQ